MDLYTFYPKVRSYNNKNLVKFKNTYFGKVCGNTNKKFQQEM